jgi:hypothetical protein
LDGAVRGAGVGVGGGIMSLVRRSCGCVCIFRSAMVDILWLLSGIDSVNMRVLVEIVKHT